jgi:hypothetical protein
LLRTKDERLGIKTELDNSGSRGEVLEKFNQDLSIKTYQSRLINQDLSIKTYLAFKKEEGSDAVGLWSVNDVVSKEV